MHLKAVEVIKSRARGQWPLILKNLGRLPTSALTNKHQPCPLCGGKDRYRFDDQEGSGSWYCSRCGGIDGQGGGGDGFALLMRLRQWTFAETVEAVAAWLGEDMPCTVSSSAAEGVSPVPKVIPIPSSPHHFALGVPEAVWVYHDAQDKILMLTARFKGRGGQPKQILPYTLWKAPTGLFEWRWKALPGKKPLYGLQDLARNSHARVLIVEGEKTCEAAKELLPDWVIVTWPGGCNAVSKVDWTPLSGREVYIWPDADKVGIKAAEEIQKHVASDAKSILIVQPPSSMPEGWDLADAEIDGWTTAQTISWIEANSYHQGASEAAVDNKTLPVWLKRPSQSELSKALAKFYKDRFIFDTKAGRWYEWQTSKWVFVSEHVIKKVLSDDIEEAFKLLQNGFSYTFLQNCMQFIALDNTLEKWNTDPNYLPLKNGLLDLTTQELLPHQRIHYFNWQLPFAYDPQAQCPAIKAWLYEVAQQDEGMVKVLQAWLNAVVKGRTDIQRYLELIGPASTGKSTFLRLAMSLIGGENTITTDLRQLEKNRFETASLYGMRLTLITDSSRYGGHVEVLKAITGGDPIRFEEKHRRKGESFTPTCLIMLAANEPIQATDYTSGLQRRRLTLPFNNRISPEKRDASLELRLSNELPGLLNWILKLTDQEVTTLLCKPELYSLSIAKMLDHNLTDTNPLAAWLDEQVRYEPTAATKIGVKDIDGTTPSKDFHLYPNYVYFCEQRGLCAIAQRRFSNTLLDLCASLNYPVERVRTKQGWFFKGLALQPILGFQGASMVTGYKDGASSPKEDR